MKKILTFLASLFTLTLLLVVCLGQSINVNASEAKVSLDFTEEDGNFSVFSGNNYSTTKNVDVELSGKTDESAMIEIAFNATELVVVGVDGVKSSEFSVPEKGLLRIITTENKFTINFKVADESLDVYGVPFVGEVKTLQVADKEVASNSETEFYFTRGYYGDLNLDGNIDLLDYAYLRTVLLGNDVTVDGEVVDVNYLADINHDGNVNFDDYNYLYNEIKNNEGNNNLPEDTFSDAVYCTITYVEDGNETHKVAYPFGTEVEGQKVTNHIEVEVESSVNEYKVIYFFSTEVNSTPVVDYATEGEKLELIIPNGTGLYNGYIRWYSYELNLMTGKFEMIPVSDDYVMPGKDLYLYAQYTNQYFPLLVYKINDILWTQTEYKFFDTVTVEDINSVNSAIDWNNALLEGYKFGGWYTDEECTTEVADFTILADTTVYAKMEPKTYQVTYVKNNGEEDQVEDVKYLESIEELAVAKPGYMFLGWYAEGAEEPFDFANERMPAKSITLTAKWYDIVKDAAEQINGLLDKAGASSIVHLEYDESLVEVNELTAVLDLDQLFDYQNIDLNREALEDVLNRICDYCATNYTIDALALLEVNGYDVYDNGVFNLSNIKAAAISVVKGLPNDATLTLNGSRDVTISFDVVGSQENIDLVKEYVEQIEKHLSISYNQSKDLVVVDVLVPQSIISEFEEYSAESGKTVEEIVNDLTVKDALLIVDKAYDKALTAEHKALIDKFALALLEEFFAWDLVGASSATFTIAGYEIALTTNATTVDELLDELVGANSQLGDLGDVLMSTFNKNGVYEIPMSLDVTLPDIPQLNTNQFVENVLFRITWNSVAHTVTFEGNGEDTLKVNGIDANVASDIFGTKVYTEISKNGYTFEGWYDNPELLGNPVSSVDQDDNVYITIPHANATYYAKWEAIEYTVSYELMDDSTDVAELAENSPVLYIVEDGIITLLDSTRPHYTFAGWYETSDYSTEVVTSFDATDAEDKLYYAKWTPVTYEIHFTGDRGQSESGFFVRDYATMVDLTAIYEDAAFSVEKQGWDIIGWLWVYESDRDDLTVEPNEVLSGVTFKLDGDILAWPIYKAQTATVTFDPAYGTVEPTSKEVVFGQTYGELPVPTRTGYEFLGWYLNGVEVTSETIYNSYVTDRTSPDYYKAKDVTLVAKWSVIDIVDNATDEMEDFINNAFENNSEFPYTFEETTADFVNKDGETVTLVNEVVVKINLDKLDNLDSYQVNTSYVTEANLEALLKQLYAEIVKDFEMVNDITVNGHVVYANGKYQNEGVLDLLEELTYSLIDDLAEGNVPTLDVVVDDTVCERTVKVSIVLEGSQSRLEKVQEIAGKLQNHVTVEFNDKVNVTIKVPQSIVKELEQKIVDEHPGLTLEEVLNTVTLEEALNILVDKAEEVFAGQSDLIDAVAKLLYRSKDIFTANILGDKLAITVNGENLFAEGAEFNPTSESFDDVIAALVKVINPTVLATPLSELNPENNGIYTFPLYVLVDLTEYDLFVDNVLDLDIIVNFVFNASEYDIELDANGGEFTSGYTVETITGVVGEALTVEPTRDLYYFVGWEDIDGNEYTSIPNENITLYAKWEERKYNINYALNTDGNYDGTFDLVYYGPDGVTPVTETSVIEALGEGYTVTSVYALATAKSNEGYYQFAGWTINGTSITEIVDGNVRLVSNATELILAELATLSFQDDTIELVAQWTNTPFEIQFLYPDGTPGAKFDKYYTEYDSSDAPVASSVKRIVYESEVVINNLITKDYYMSFNEIGKTQIGWSWKFESADDSTYQDLDLYATIVVEGNIIVKPLMIGKTIEITLDANTGTITPDTVYIKYATDFTNLATDAEGSYDTALSTYVPAKDGYVFKGWYYGTTLITDATMAEGSARDALNFDLYNITLVAKWEDIYNDLYQYAQDNISTIVPGLLDSDPIYNSESLLEKLIVYVDVDNLLAGNLTLDETQVDNVITNLVDYLEENYDTLDRLFVNGVIVYEDGKVINEGLVNAYADYKTNIDTTREIVLVAECGTVTRTLTVDFQAKEGTTQESLDILERIQDTIDSIVSVDYYTGDINVVIPNSVVVELEGLASAEGKTLENYLGEYTVKELFDLVYDRVTDDEFKQYAQAAYDFVANLFVTYEADMNDSLVNGLVTVEGISSLEDIEAIGNVELSTLYNSTKSTGDNLVYSKVKNVVVDASGLTTATEAYEGTVNITVTLVKNEYDINFYETDENGNPTLLETLSGYVGEVAAPTSPSRIGYAFEGWYSVPQVDYVTDYSAYVAKTVYENRVVELYAHFSQNDVVITYDANNGEFTDGDVTKVDDDSFGTTYDLYSNAPTRTYYNFVGWTTVKDDETTLLSDLSVISNPDNHTVYALWQAVEYTVNFYAADVNELDAEGKPQDVVASKVFTVLTSVTEFEALLPSLASYQVPGYTTAWETVDATVLANLLNTAETSGTNSVDVYAIYTTITYTITFVADGKTMGIVEYNVTMTSVTEPAIVEKAGYVSEYEAYTLDKNAPGDLVVNAIYTEKVFNLVFDINTGTFDAGDTENRAAVIKYNEVLDMYTVYTTLYKAGNAFIGWYYVEDGLNVQVKHNAKFDYADIINLPNNSTVTLVAQWDGVDYNVSYNVGPYSYSFGKIKYAQEYTLTDTYSFPTHAVTAKVFTYDIHGNEVAYQRTAGVDLVLDIVTYDPLDDANDAYYTITVYNYIVVRFYDENGDLI